MVLVLTALLAGCGAPDPKPGDKKVRVGSAEPANNVEPREYALVHLSGESRTFAVRLPGKPVEGLVTIDGQGNGSIVSATVDCGRKTMSFGSPRLIKDGVASGRPGGPGIEGAFQMMTEEVCSADWKTAIRTADGNLLAALSSVKPKKSGEAERIRDAYMRRRESK